MLTRHTLFAVAATLLGSTSLLSTDANSQVYATGPNGQVGYIGTPNPISPNCTAPDVWTPFNGHFMCAPPQPGCQYGYAAGPVWNGSAWVYSCNAPPAPPPPVNQPGQGSPTTPTRASLLAACENAIRSAMPGQAYGGTILPISNGNYGQGWYAEENIFQWGGAGTYLTGDGTFQIWLNAYGAGLDGVFTGVDNNTAEQLYSGRCTINDTTGAISYVGFVPVQTRCSGCGS